MSNFELIETKLSENSKRCEDFLHSYISNQTVFQQLIDAEKYSLFSGGKRIRPCLAIETFKMFSDDDISHVMPFAAALEMVHTYSLIHDDLPCMDDDDFRRNKPSNHKVYGEATALLAGDGLLTDSFFLIVNNPFVSDKSKVKAVSELSRMAGSSGMVGGQCLDLFTDNHPCNENELLQLYTLKTGNLLSCAMKLGLLAAFDSPGSSVINDIELYAKNIGIAFQIKDDILDITSSFEELGKPIGSDNQNHKTTYLSFHTLDEANDEIERLSLEASNIIIKYPHHDMLASLPMWLSTRKK